MIVPAECGNIGKVWLLNSATRSIWKLMRADNRERADSIP